MTDRPIPSFRIDPLHPDRMTCELCGETVAAVSLDEPARVESLSLHAALHAWPELALDLVTHYSACFFAHKPEGASGGIFVAFDPSEVRNAHACHLSRPVSVPAAGLWRTARRRAGRPAATHRCDRPRRHWTDTRTTSPPA
jgi:hypothetical protein